MTLTDILKKKEIHIKRKKERWNLLHLFFVVWWNRANHTAVPNLFTFHISFSMTLLLVFVPRLTCWICHCPLSNVYHRGYQKATSLTAVVRQAPIRSSPLFSLSLSLDRSEKVDVFPSERNPPLLWWTPPAPPHFTGRKEFCCASLDSPRF